MTGQAHSHSRQSDQQIVALILAGDTAVFEHLLRRYNQRMYRVCRAVLGNHAIAEEAVQDAWVKAFGKLEQFRGSYSIGPWLCRIALNEARAVARKLARRRALSQTIAVDSGLAGHGDSPENDLMHHQLRAAIDALPSEYRVVFVLREIEGLSLSETAALLEIRPGTIKSRAFRARSLLQARLGSDFVHASPAALAFAGADCDRLVSLVMARIHSAAC